MFRPVVCLFIAASALLVAPCGAGDMKTEISARTAAWEKAFNAGDAAAVAAIYTNDGMLLPPNAQSVNGRAAIERFWANDMDDTLTLTLETREVGAAGDDSAYEIGAYAVKDAKGEAVDTGKYLTVWQHDGKDWYLRRDIWNSDEAPKSATMDQ